MVDNESLCSFKQEFTLPVKDPRNIATFRAIFALFVVYHTHTQYSLSHRHFPPFSSLFILLSLSPLPLVNIFCKYCSAFLRRAGRVKALTL